MLNKHLLINSAFILVDGTVINVLDNTNFQNAFFPIEYRSKNLPYQTLECNKLKKHGAHIKSLNK